MLLDALMLNWSLIHWGLTRWSFPGRLYFCSYTQMAEGPRQSRARVQDTSSMEDLAHCPSSADLLIYCALAPSVRFFIISSLPGWLSPISPRLWSNSHREPLMISVVTTFTGHADFLLLFPPALCLDSSPVLSDCPYPGLFVVTFPKTHISPGIQIFAFPEGYFYAFRASQSIPIKVELKFVVLNIILVCYTCYISL